MLQQESDTVEYLPKSRALFRKFYNSHIEDYHQNIIEFKTGPRSGYGNYHRDSEVTQHMRDIYHNLNDNFDGLYIPENFPSPKSLANAWQTFYKFLVSKNELFDDILKHLSTSNNYAPFPFVAIYRCHQDVLYLLEEILSMDEVKIHFEKTSEEIITDNNTNIRFDIVILTALYDTEFEAFKKFSDFQDFVEPLDDTKFLSGKIGSSSVLIATDDTMGIASATSLSTELIIKYSPKYLIMGGIAAGAKGKPKNFGDLLVARYTWNYESGKYSYNSTRRKTIFQPHPEQIELDQKIVNYVNDTKSDKALMQNIKDSFIESKDDKKPSSILRVFLGPLASGSAVLAVSKKIQDIKKWNRKLIGIDMETYGVFYAAKMLSKTYGTKAISIKGISDFADQTKSDGYRNYAAYTSANFIYQLILNKL